MSVAICQVVKLFFDDSLGEEGCVERIGEKLHTLRVRHAYTARELADLLAVSHTHILRMEKGEKGPSASLILKISQLFQISADKLLRDDLEIDD